MGGHRLELQKKSGVNALRGGWTITGIAKKVQNQEDVCARGWVDNDLNCKKKVQDKRVYALRGG